MSIACFQIGDLVPIPPKPRLEDEIITKWKGDINKPIVSICCATYNHERYIDDTIQGFLGQETDFPFEILIHDDASTDHTGEIIREYVSNYPTIIKSIHQKENQFSKGVSPNLAFNFPKAKGEFIALCEGDDFWISGDKLKKQVDALNESPDCVLCFHDALKVDEWGGFLQKMIPCNKRYLSSAELAKAPFSPTLTRMFRNVGFPWEKERNLPTAMDVCLAAYLSQFGGAIYLGSEVLSAYRTHATGVWSLKNQNQKTRMTVDSKLYMASYFKIERDNTHSEKMFAYHMSSAATTILDQLQFYIAMKYLIRYIALRTYWFFRKAVVRSLNFFKSKIRSK